MSRWKSPQIAAKHAERAARKAAKKRKEKRIGVLLVICWAVVSFGLCIADYFWMRHRARQQHERFHQRQQGTNKLTVQTNQTGGAPPKEMP